MRAHRLLLWVLVASALAVRFAGIDWARLHPDEIKIEEWIEFTDDHSYIQERVYPNGFFRLIQPVRKTAFALMRLSHRWAVWTGSEQDPYYPRLDTIRFARMFNVCLGALTCVLIYLLGRRVTGSRWAGLFAAALLAFHPHHIEHCHYAETDVAMVFMLTLALWLWAVAADRRRLFILLLAALASGFAAGTKFVLVVLVPLAVIYGVWLGVVAPRGRARRALLYSAAGLVAFALGFAWANPGVTHLSWFLASAKHEAARVYGETRGLLAAAASDPGAAFTMRERDLLRCVAALGPGWIGLALAAVPCLILRPFRRYWAVMLFVPALYLYYSLCRAPWMRSQEFLNFLPFLCVAPAVPLLLIRRIRPAAAGPAPRAVLIALLAFITLAPVAKSGWGMASLFGWKDTRLSAQDWLTVHAPAERTVGAESYTDPAFIGNFDAAIDVSKIESSGMAFARSNRCEYLLRNETQTGRGVFDVRTDTRYPIYQARFDEFLAQSELLKVWAPLPGALSSFSNPEIQLWGLRRFAARPDAKLDLAQPLALLHPRLRTFFEAGHQLGAALGTVVDRTARTVAVGGPRELSGPIYAILNTEGRPADVTLSGFGKKRRVRLGPFDVKATPLRRTSTLTDWRRFEPLTVQARAEPHIEEIPCFLRIAFSASEAARWCARLGRPDEGARLLREAGADSGDAVATYRLAVETGDWETANRLAASGPETGAFLEQALAAEPSAFRVDGISGYYWNEFARLRCDGLFPSVLAVGPAGGTAPGSRGGVYVASAPLPVRIADGVYTVSGEILVKPVRTVASTNSLFELRAGDAPPAISGTLSDVSADRWLPFSATVLASRERALALAVRSEEPASVHFRGLQVRWDVKDLLKREAAGLRADMARHLLHQGHPAEALALVPEVPATWPTMTEALRLKFECSLQAWGPDHTNTLAAAGELLQAAPGHYGAMRALASRSPEIRARCQALDSTLGTPVVFAPFVSVVGAEFNAQDQRVTCVIEGLRDETPPLQLVLLERRLLEWRPRASAFVRASPALSAGERVRIDLRWDGKSGKNLDPSRAAIRIQMAVPWKPCPLPADGEPGGVVRLDRMIARNARSDH